MTVPVLWRKILRVNLANYLRNADDALNITVHKFSSQGASTQY